jgi:uncharacterized protein YmfQ (DUF2313 family)
MGLVAGLAEIWGSQIDVRAADLLERESDPRSTIELLEDWERVAGLPDPCVAEPLTIEARRAALVNKLTTEGGQSRAFFIGVAAALGYTITIREHSPFMCGISQCGVTEDDAGDPYWEIGAPEIRFFWSVRVGAVRVSWWRFGSAVIGVDPHVRIALATDLECLFRRWKPAHTEVVFDYSAL